MIVTHGVARMNQFPPVTSAQIYGQWACWTASILLCIGMLYVIRRIPQGMRLRWIILNCIFAPVIIFIVAVVGGESGVRSWSGIFLVMCHVACYSAMLGMAVFRDGTGSLLSSFLITFGFLILNSGNSCNARLSAQSAACRGQMFELGITLLNASDVGSFSPVTGSPPLSWRVQILPHLDPQLGAGYDTTQAWDTQPNREVGMRMPHPYRCPAHGNRPTTNRLGLATTDYALVTGPGTIFPTPDSVLDLKRITDGASNTILMTECSGLFIPWTEPRDVDVSREKMTINELGPGSGSPSVLSSYEVTRSREWSCVHVLRADGSVRRFDPSKTDPEVIRKMMTANGGENIDDNDF